MIQPSLATISLLVAGVFALVMINSAPVVDAQSTFPIPQPPTSQIIPQPPTSTFAQPCVNNGSNVLGKDTGKQILNQENQCAGTPKNVNQPPVTCSVPNGSVISPISVTVSTPSQTVPRGSAVTLTATAVPSVVSSGFGISSTCSQLTGTIPPGGFSWIQTSGVQVNATTTNLPTFVFTAPTVSTTLVFTVTVTDSNGQTTTSQPAIISVP
jgi:hypothetical protein